MRAALGALRSARCARRVALGAYVEQDVEALVGGEERQAQPLVELLQLLRAGRVRRVHLLGSDAHAGWPGRRPRNGEGAREAVGELSRAASPRLGTPARRASGANTQRAPHLDELAVRQLPALGLRHARERAAHAPLLIRRGRLRAQFVNRLQQPLLAQQQLRGGGGALLRAEPAARVVQLGHLSQPPRLQLGEERLEIVVAAQETAPGRAVPRAGAGPRREQARGQGWVGVSACVGGCVGERWIGGG